MDGLEITVLLGAAVLVGALVAPRLRVAVPLLLLAFGLVLGFVPELREVQLPPETVLLLFLPVMLFWESLTTSLRAIRRDLRGIVLMSTLLVVATAFAVAGAAHLMGLPWEIALILGAAVAPPDATAVAALGRTLPHRNFMVLKAESLTNDGTALVISSVAVGVAIGGQYTPWTITGLVVLSYAGGVVAGLAVAGVAYLLMRRLRDALTINIALLLTPFAAFLVAELVHASGVLAVVVAGLIAAWVAPRTTTAASRRQTEAAWPLGTFLLNGALFVLIGLEVQHVAHTIDAREVGRLLGVTVVVWLVTLVVRFAFQMTTVTMIRLLDRRPSQRERRMSHRARVVSTVAGFRGAVSLAIALSVPLATADGSALTGREDIVFVTAGVIVLTLLVQGPLLPVVVRWARLPEDRASDEEYELAQRAITGAALASLDELAAAHAVSDEVRDRIRDDVSETLELANAQRQAREQERVDREVAVLEGMLGPSDDAERAAEAAAIEVLTMSPITRHEEHTRLRLALLARKREVLYGLRADGSVDDGVVNRIQARLDLEELRLTGIEPVA
ncbi:putative Na(+)/H(+) exchanger [Microbacterium barkeri]|uniref:Na(+)/H(+) exchanger n=1 Tax=Microbacterium barkeri TaxID=33917 RepID=A0A9W6H5R5_9MICO|nr:Na+/H+ antiporter [Microbacterium barkeri]MDR6876842.1 CPA1 family monovalent cation:H+ antiporter [Microbacterium barkeri]GLJ62823.1 putative Na(+)/H(+) exchanger [Microbacterium barkeri]